MRIIRIKDVTDLEKVKLCEYCSVRGDKMYYDILLVSTQYKEIRICHCIFTPSIPEYVIRKVHYSKDDWLQILNKSLELYDVKVVIEKPTKTIDISCITELNKIKFPTFSFNNYIDSKGMYIIVFRNEEKPFWLGYDCRSSFNRDIAFQFINDLLRVAKKPYRVKYKPVKNIVISELRELNNHHFEDFKIYADVLPDGYCTAEFVSCEFEWSGRTRCIDNLLHTINRYFGKYGHKVIIAKTFDDISELFNWLKSDKGDMYTLGTSINKDMMVLINSEGKELSLEEAEEVIDARLRIEGVYGYKEEQ